MRDVVFLRDGNENRCDLTLAVGLFDPDGKLIRETWQELNLHPNDAALAVLRRDGVPIDTAFEVVPGSYVVRLLVSDREGRAVGMQSMLVNVRP